MMMKHNEMMSTHCLYPCMLWACIPLCSSHRYALTLLLLLLLQSQAAEEEQTDQLRADLQHLLTVKSRQAGEVQRQVRRATLILPVPMLLWIHCWSCQLGE